MRTALRITILATLAAGCGESSVTDVGEGPYALTVRLLDPATGVELTAAAGTFRWSQGLADGPLVEVEYHATRATPSAALTLRVVGATFAADAVPEDPWGEAPTADSDEATIPLDVIDPERRSVRLGLAPPSRPGTAVVTAILGTTTVSTTVDFTRAEIALAAPAAAVADGHTETPITVTGLSGQVVPLETSLGHFVAPGLDVTASVTLRPASPDTPADGTATIGLVSETPGTAVVSVVGSAAAWALVVFDRVRLTIGAPDPVAFEPGRIVHDVCVAANTDVGEILLVGRALDAEVLDLDPLPVLPADGGALPPGCPDGSFAGHALFRWAAGGSTDVLTATWNDPDFLVTAGASARVTGEVFSGYDASVDFTELGFDDPYPLLIEAHLDYLDAGALTGGPAGGVPLTFLVISSYGAVELAADGATGPGGLATAVYEVAADDALQVFLQPEGWSTVFVGSYP